MISMFNTMILIAIWIIYLYNFRLYAIKRQLGMNMGLNIGIMHLVLIPLSVFASMGTLAGSPDGMVPAVDWVSNQAAVLKIVSMVFLYGCWDLLRHQRTQVQTQEIASPTSLWDSFPKLKPIVLVSLFFFMSLTLFVVTGLASGGHWADAKAEYLQEGGTRAVLSFNIFGAVRVSTLIVVASLYLYDRVTPKWIFTCLGLICLVDLYTTGNRMFTLQVVVVIGTLLIIKRRWFQLGMMGLASIPFGVLMTIFPAIRVYMHSWSGGWKISSATAALSEGYAEAKDFFLPDLGIAEFLIGITEGRNMNALVVVVEEFHQVVGLLMGTGILRGFVFWIPRSIWPNKPQNLTVMIGQHLFSGGERGVSMGATIFGEFWANFGFFGFAMIPFVLYCINRALSWFIRDPAMRAVAAFLFGYSVVRMPVSDFCILFLFVIVVLNMTRLQSDSPVLTAR